MKQHLELAKLQEDWRIVADLYKRESAGICWYLATIQAVAILKKADPYFLTHHYLLSDDYGGIYNSALIDRYTGGLYVETSVKHKQEAVKVLTRLLQLSEIGLKAHAFETMAEMRDLLSQQGPHVIVTNMVRKDRNHELINYHTTCLLIDENGNGFFHDSSESKADTFSPQEIRTWVGGGSFGFKNTRTGELDYYLTIHPEFPGYVVTKSVC